MSIGGMGRHFGSLFAIVLSLQYFEFSTANHYIKKNYKWTTQKWYTGSELDISSTVDMLDNLYILGSKKSDAEYLYTIEKIDGLDGHSIWEYSWPANEKRTPKGLCADSDGNIFVVGSSNASLYNSFVNNINNTNDAYVEKWNGTDGQVLWGYQFGTNYSDIAMAVLAVETGNIYVAGTTGGSLFAQKKLGDAMFVVEISPTNGSVLDGFQDAAGSVRRKADSIATVLRSDRNGHVMVFGQTEGLYNSNRDGGDVFAVKFNERDLTDRKWAAQYDGLTSYDWVGGSGIDADGNVYILGYSIIKINGTSGDMMWRRLSAVDREQYQFTSLVVLDEHIILAGYYLVAEEDINDDEVDPTYDLCIGLIASNSVSGKVKWKNVYVSPGNNEKGLMMMENWHTGNKYIVGSTDMNVTLPPGVHPPGSAVLTDRKVWKVRVFDDPPPPISLGYKVNSGVVITALTLLCTLPVFLLLVFCHRDPSIPFFVAFRRIFLPVLDLITDVLFLLTGEFFSKELFRLCVVDLLCINFLPVVFYEWAVYKNSRHYQQAVNAGGRFTPLLDCFCICSVDAKNCFKDYEANDSWPCDAHGKRFPHPCNVMWTFLVMLASLAAAAIDLGVKFFFYEFKLLNYLFKSQHRYVKENQYLNQRAQNYEILTHVLTQSLIQLVIQTINASFMRHGYTNIAILSISVSAANIVMAIYWYVLRYCIYLSEGTLASFTNLGKVAAAVDEDEEIVKYEY